MTIHRRAAKRDEGEPAIVGALRRAGAMVWHLSQKGLPDLLIGFRGRWVLMEVKAPLGPLGGESGNGQHLQPEQVRFFADAELGELPAHVVRSPEEALRVIGVELKGMTR